MSRLRSSSLASQGSVMLAHPTDHLEMASKLASRKSFTLTTHLVVNEGLASSSTVTSAASAATVTSTTATAATSSGKLESLVKRFKKKVSSSVSAPASLSTHPESPNGGLRFRNLRAMSEDSTLCEDEINDPGSCLSDEDDESGSSSNSRSDTSTLSLPVPRWHSKSGKAQKSLLRSSTASDLPAGARAESSSAIITRPSSSQPRSPRGNSQSTARRIRASSSSTSSSPSHKTTSAAQIPNTSLAYSMIFGELAVKCVYQGSKDNGVRTDISLVRVNEARPDFDRFLEQLESIHGFTKRGVEVDLVYVDKDGDKVRVKDSGSLAYACNDWRSQQKLYKERGRRRQGCDAGSLRITAKEKRRQS